MTLTNFLVGFTILLFFTFQISARKINFPNELKGFEFYNRGKLQDFQDSFKARKNDFA
jgi:hypothetical protein